MPPTEAILSRSIGQLADAIRDAADLAKWWEGFAHGLSIGLIVGVVSLLVVARKSR